MRVFRLMILVMAAALSVGCGAVRFDVEEPVPEQRVPGSVLGGVLSSFIASPFRLDVDLQSETEKRGTGPATSAVLKRIALQITPHASPSGNFDFLSELHLQVEGPGLMKKEIANLAPVPMGQTTLELKLVPDVDLLPYINAGATISGQAKGTQPARDITFDGTVVVEVRI